MPTRTHNLIALAALSATAGLSIALAPHAAIGQAVPPAKVSPTPANSSPQLPAGITPKALNSEKSIEKTCAKITEDGLAKNDFSAVVGYLVDQDQTRIKKSTTKSLNDLDGQHNKALNDTITSLQTAWKAKYNQALTIDYQQSLNTLPIATGEVSDPTQLVDHWPVIWARNAKTTGQLTAGDAQIARNRSFGGPVKLDKGRSVAILHLPGGATLGGNSHTPDLTASLIDEHLTGWRFDIPNTLDAQQLYDSLTHNLTQLNTNRDFWPADVHDAQRLFTHAVIASLYDVDIAQTPDRASAAK